MKKYEPDFKQLDKLTKEGFIRKVISPCGRLFLYNYTDKCTYEKKWNKHTLNARGTVYEVETGNVVAMAFPKFFNFGELSVSQQRNLLKQTDFQSFEKFDGSFGLVFNYKGEWMCTTRGSFTSDQALKAAQMLKEKYNGLKQVPEWLNLRVEIIYPENRIIVDYGDREALVLLSVYDLGTNSEISLGNSYLFSNMENCRKHVFGTIDQLIEAQSKLGKMEEGFVVRFANGFRCKFKSAAYLKIARIISNMTPLAFWKAMTNGKVSPSVLEEIPEEFREASDKIQSGLRLAYFKVSNEIQEDYHYAVESIGGINSIEESRKDLGIFIQLHGKEMKHPGAIFPKLLNKGLEKYIMKEIRPKGNEIVV